MMNRFQPRNVGKIRSPRNSLSALYHSPRSISMSRLAAIRPRTAPGPISNRQFESFLAEVDTDPVGQDLKDILLVLFHTGLRIGELARLRWADVDLDGRHLTVRRGKDGKARLVPFGNKVAAVMIKRRERVGVANYVLGQDPWPVLKGAQRKMWELQSQSTARKITFRLLRLLFISRWLRLGGDLEELALISGIRLPMRMIEKKIPVARLFESAARFQERLEGD